MSSVPFSYSIIEDWDKPVIRCGNCLLTKLEAGVDEDLQKCGGCRIQSYCSKACQKAHWKKHKPNCQHNKAFAERMPSDVTAVHTLVQTFVEKHRAIIEYIGMSTPGWLPLKLGFNLPESVSIILMKVVDSAGQKKLHVENVGPIPLNSLFDMMPKLATGWESLLAQMRSDKECIGGTLVVILCDGLSRLIPIHMTEVSRIIPKLDPPGDWVKLVQDAIDSISST